MKVGRRDMKGNPENIILLKHAEKGAIVIPIVHACRFTIIIPIANGL
jgi:hypothetical protein